MDALLKQINQYAADNTRDEFRRANDPLQYWWTNRKQYYLLYPVALRLAAVTATSVKSE